MIDDQPNEYVGSGSIWLDDLTALDGAEAYDFRWLRGNAAIDVVFAPAGATVRIPTASATARIVNRDGVASEPRRQRWVSDLWADGRPHYVHHTPGAAQSAPTPPPLSSPSLPLVPAQPDEAFRNVWNRSDAAVASGEASRSWLWGPESYATARENYVETADGRVVQYWDKSRMEITNPGGNRADLWFVTNGLLTKELISGRMQVGNGAFVERAPAQVPIAGDPVNNTGPTYASFGAVASLNGDRGVPAACRRDGNGAHRARRRSHDGRRDGTLWRANRLLRSEPAAQHPVSFWRLLPYVAVGLGLCDGISDHRTILDDRARGWR